MTSIFFWIAALSFMGVVFVINLVRSKRYAALEKQALIENYGKKPHILKPERWDFLDGYFKRHQSQIPLDQITWNDLEMDAVFATLNFTHSAIGEEYLYALIRNNEYRNPGLEEMEEKISYLMTHSEERGQLEYLLYSLGYTGKYSIYDYIHHLDVLGKRSNFSHIVCDVLLVIFIGMIAFLPPAGIIGCLVMILYNIITYFSEKSKLEPYIISFQFVFRMITSAEKLSAVKIPAFSEEFSRLGTLYQQVKTMKNGFGLVEKGSQPISTGNPLDILTDYLRMMFHLDIILFNRMYLLMEKYQNEIDEMLGIIGEIDAYDAIGAYRTSLEGDYCIPVILNTNKKNMQIQDGYHPLMKNAVKNSICTESGILITGSNASGKSSFLKMVAINAILAQTIHTAMASDYQAAYFHIFSSMSLRDNLQGQDSYFMVEIKSIKRILDVDDSQIPVLCFVDEVLRGTNTVERIAASTQILKCLNQKNTLCFAATHDIELTYLLEETYTNYHFEEELVGEDVVFFYRLVPGRTTTKNAILLLKQLGYETNLTDEAQKLVEHFESTGKWED